MFYKELFCFFFLFILFVNSVFLVCYVLRVFFKVLFLGVLIYNKLLIFIFVRFFCCGFMSGEFVLVLLLFLFWFFIFLVGFEDFLVYMFKCILFCDFFVLFICFGFVVLFEELLEGLFCGEYFLFGESFMIG